jgi:hypothetical protein
MNRENKAMLQRMEREQQRAKYPNMPEHALAGTNWQDNSANALTKSIIGFLNMSGHFAERINTQGTYRQGRKLKVGEGTRQMPGKYVPTTGVKGSADISCTIKGRSVKIEVKFKNDRQSEDQKKYQVQTEAAGGIYYVARDFDSFKEWYDELILSL